MRPIASRVDRGDVRDRVAELGAPVGAGPPGRALEDEAHAVGARDVDVALVVADQELPALDIAQQREGREEGQVQPVLEDQAGLDAAVGQEEGAVALGQAVAILGGRLHLFPLQDPHRRFAARELAAGKFASSTVMSRLSELLFVEAVRDYATGLEGEQSGWLGGLRDPQVGRALALLHGGIDSDWTADRLAREVSMSRSAFNDRFTALVGMPPIRYLTHWRLQMAKEKLRGARQNIAQIAHAVGYDSEVAFNRAFKREFGEPPARWRDLQGNSDKVVIFQCIIWNN